MKAIRFHQTGGPEVLKLEEVEKPQAHDGQVLVRVKCVGVNFADTLLRQGKYLMAPRFPETPGVEASGIVESLGPGADAALAGKRVAVLGAKTYAEYVVATVDQLLPLPDSLGWEEGAALPIQSLTAYHLLFTAGKIAAGSTVLIHAAAGGTGLQAVQMAKLAGARVFGTASTPEKAALAREMGADEVILYTQDDFGERVHQLTNGRGVDLVLDSVGKATFIRSLRALAPFGHLISYGAASGPADTANLLPMLYGNSIKVSAFWLVTVKKNPGLMRKGIEEVLAWLATGKLRIKIGLVLPLDQAAEAHRKMESRESMGKILLTVG